MKVSDEAGQPVLVDAIRDVMDKSKIRYVYVPDAPYAKHRVYGSSKRTTFVVDPRTNVITIVGVTHKGGTKTRAVRTTGKRVSGR